MIGTKAPSFITMRWSSDNWAARSDTFVKQTQRAALLHAGDSSYLSNSTRKDSLLFGPKHDTTGCPNRFQLAKCNVLKLRILLRKCIFRSKKFHFEPFLWTIKMKMEFWSNFSPIVLFSNLFSKLFDIWEKLLRNPFSCFAVHKKGSKQIFLERNIFIFVNIARLVCKQLWASEQCFWPVPNLLGNPVNDRPNWPNEKMRSGSIVWWSSHREEARSLSAYQISCYENKELNKMKYQHKKTGW